MALANYTDLQASIALWLNRTDLTSVIPDFIALFEANFNTEGAIRTQFNRVSTALTTTINQNYVSVPADYLSTDSAIIVQNNRYYPLVPFAGATSLYTAYPDSLSAPRRPAGYFNLASKLELGPVPDAVYGLNLYYYQVVPPLSLNATNWLLTNFPQIYLFGSLIASEAFLGSNPNLQTWGNMYDNVVQKLQGATDRNKYGGAALSVKVDAVA